jgi:hypothetical protein
MKLTQGERRFLMTLMTVTQKVLEVSSAPSGRVGTKPRKRRSGADVVLLKKEVRAALKRKVPISGLHMNAAARGLSQGFAGAAILN